MQVGRLDSKESIKLVLNGKTSFAGVRGKLYSGAPQ